MHGRRHIGELHETTEILDCGVTALAVEIAYERRAVNGRENDGIAADMDAAGWIARMPGKLLRRCLEQFAAKPLREMHPLALHIRTGFVPEIEEATRILLDRGWAPYDILT